MYQLEVSQITGWRRQNNSVYANYFPGAISSLCPFCNATVSFAFPHWHKALHGYALANVPCPACNEKVRFMLMDHDPSQEEMQEAATLWIHPTPNIREPIPDLYAVGKVDKRLQRAYESTITIYNSGEWNATAILARRFLDGMLDSFLPEGARNEPLEDKLRMTIEGRDFCQPLQWLADTLSDNCEVGQSFELMTEPDRESVGKMIDLMNLLVEYMYLMPHRADRFHTRTMPQKSHPVEQPVARQPVDDDDEYLMDSDKPLEIQGSRHLRDEDSSMEVMAHLESRRSDH